MDVTKRLTHAGGRDNMLPRAGENTLDQLRERVQGLEEEPVAATFDDAGEPELEFDESSPMPVRTPWVVGTVGNDQHVAVSKDDKKSDTLRRTAAQLVADPNKTHKIVGDNEAQIDGTAADTGWLEAEVKDAGGDSTDAQLVLEHKGPKGCTSPLAAPSGYIETVGCAARLWFDAVGHCIGWTVWTGSSYGGWESPWGVQDPR